MKIKLKNSVVNVEIADSFFKQMVGLSFSGKKNMLFVMPYERRWRMWMFGVKFPLKIIFINKKKVVVDIKEANPITLNPKTWKVYAPKKSCKYILETPYKLKVKIEDKFRW